jgi:hypothetical protein
MSPQIKYAYKTHNTWVYRRTYPKALQPLLGSALKQSLKTGDAREAKLRVAELNQTFTTIIKEAQAHALATPHTDTPTAAQGPRLAVGRPRYQRARLVGERLVADLAKAYLAEVSRRLRPGSFKSVRFALELLTSHLGKHAVGDLSLSHGKEVLGYITQLSPNVRKYRRGRTLAWLTLQACQWLLRVSLWHPRPRLVSSSRCPSSLTGVLAKGSWDQPLGSPQGQRQARRSSPWGADG